MLQTEDLLTAGSVAVRDEPRLDTDRGSVRNNDEVSRPVAREMPALEQNALPEPPNQDGGATSSPGDGSRANRPRRPLRASLAALLLASVAGGGYLYWDSASHYETTDDAFIAARQFAIAPKVPGYITAVPVTDNQHVVAGQVIARIDDRDYRAALAQAEAQVAAAQASIGNIDAQIAVQQAQVGQSERRCSSSRPA